MAKKDTARLASLVADLSSPKVVAAIDKAIAELHQEWQDLLDLRKMAVRRHGDQSPAPASPFAEASPPVPSVHSANDARTGITWANLVDSYQTDERSPYQNIRHSTRTNYNTRLRRLVEEQGTQRLSEIPATVDAFEQMYAQWKEDGKSATAFAMIGIVRAMVNFGASVLGDPDCERLAVPLHRMRFKVERPPMQRPVKASDLLTEDQAKAIIAKAHELDMPSLALAQAIQFECKLRQKEVIGEWVPKSEPGEAKFESGNMKWIRGICWEEIDSDFVLRHPTITKKPVVINLRATAPLTVAELEREIQRLKGRPERGPLILSDYNDEPYRVVHFRRMWRRVADAVEIPKHIKNMDSRLRLIEDEDTDPWAGPPSGVLSSLPSHFDASLVEPNQGPFDSETED